MPERSPHIHVALIDTDKAIGDRLLLRRVAAALERQVNVHFAPHWHVTATVTVGTERGHHPVRLELHDEKRPAAGEHLPRERDGARRPYGSVYLKTLRHPGDWTRVASHELLEMLADPLVLKYEKGPDPQHPRKTASYLVEIGDPCNLEWYDIDGIKVSDFVLPSFYHAKAAGPYSHHRTIKKPLSVREGGYLAFTRPESPKAWFWLIHRPRTPRPVVERVHLAAGRSDVREQIDALARAALE